VRDVLVEHVDVGDGARPLHVRRRCGKDPVADLGEPGLHADRVAPERHSLIPLYCADCGWR
jgi:hypothetical protein